MGKFVSILFFLFLQVAMAQKTELVWDETSQTALDALKNSSENLKVLWWNIRESLLANVKGKNLIYQNIVKLHEGAKSPDIIIMSEFVPEAFSEQEKQGLKERYPYWDFQFYNSYNKRAGIVVMSRYPLSLKQMQDISNGKGQEDDISPDAVYLKSEEYRRFLLYEVPFKGKKYLISPVHLFNPWRDAKEQADYWGSLLACVTKATTDTVLPVGIRELIPSWRRIAGVSGRNLARFNIARGLFLDKDNNLLKQLKEHQDALGKYLGEDFQKEGIESTLVVGDFNAPHEYKGIDTLAIDMLQEHMSDALENETFHSFPAQSSPEARDYYKKIRIDHAFVAGKKKANGGWVLPLRGSDHYPLLIELP